MQRINQWMSKKWLKLKGSRFFLGTVCLAIGISWTVVWYESTKIDWVGTTKIRITNPALASVEEANASDRSLSEGELAESSSADTGITPAPHAGDVEKMICDTFGEDCRTALAIAKCESRLNPAAHGDLNLMYEKDGVEYGDSIGLFQVRMLPGRPDRDAMFNAKSNVEYAHALFHKVGWSAWLWCSEHAV